MRKPGSKIRRKVTNTDGVGIEISMNAQSFKKELKPILPAWIWCVLLPLPAILFWRSDDGRRVALGLFFIACSILVAVAFGESRKHDRSEHPQNLEAVWRERMISLAGLLFVAWIIFSTLLLELSGERDWVAVALAFGSLFPALAVPPWFRMRTRSSVAAVVFTVFTESWMKLLGCIVVVSVYGWNADSRGYTTMPWTHPNLLVWCFWFNTAALCLWFYFLGKRRFIKHANGQPEELEAAVLKQESL